MNRSWLRRPITWTVAAVAAVGIGAASVAVPAGAATTGTSVAQRPAHAAQAAQDPPPGNVGVGGVTVHLSGTSVQQSDGGNTADISTPQSMCGILQYNGTSQSTRRFYYGVPAGIDFSYRQNLALFMIPGCGDGARNYIIDSGEGLKNAMGEPVDDRHLPSPLGEPAYTSDGKGVYIEVRMNWLLNQSQAALDVFWSLCQKYTCAGRAVDPTNLGNQGPTSSTPGWNRLLAENWGGMIDEMVKDFVPGYSSNLITSMKMQHALGQQLSLNFNQYLAQVTGSAIPTACGPGTSHFKDPYKTNFVCTPPRIVVTSVDPASDLNFAKYGTSARQVNVDQAVCAAAKSCAVVIGGNGSIAVRP